MKKILLSMMSMALLAVSANAQQLTRGEMQTSTLKPINKSVVNISGAKKAEAQQVLVGLEGSDLKNTSRKLNIEGFPDWVKSEAVLAALPKDLIKQLKGYKLTGFRFSVLADLGKNAAAMVMVGDTKNGYEAVANAYITNYTTCDLQGNSIKIKWNVLNYMQPYTVTGDEGDILYGFTYEQKKTKNGENFADECYPLLLGESQANPNDAFLVLGQPTTQHKENVWPISYGENGPVFTPAFQMLAETPEGHTAIIGVMTNNDATPTHFYTINGKQLTAPQKGLNIVKMSDGTSRKVMVK